MKANMMLDVNYSKFDVEPSRKMLEEAGITLDFNVVQPDYTAAQLKEVLADYDYVIADREYYTDELLSAVPKLKLIARFGAGIENVDLASAAKNGVFVCNAPGFNSQSVAEYALGLMLTTLRSISYQNVRVRQGYWLSDISKALRGTVGLMGFGNIPRHLAKMLAPFPVEIIAYDKFMNEEKAKELNVTPVTLDELLERSDFISCHIPLMEETRHLCNEEFFSKVKKGAYFINTSRGGLVDEDALYKALTTGKLAGAGLDVLESEPPKADNPILGLENVVLSAHCAYGSDSAFEAVFERCCKSIVQHAKGETPDFLVNPDVLKQPRK